MRSINKTPRALDDLVEIGAFLGQESLSAEVHFYEAAETAFRCLMDMPYLGNARQFKDARLKGLRMWCIPGFENYLIFYRPISDGIEIVRVLHGARDIETIFEESSRDK